MLKLNNLYISNFGRFTDKQEINFRELGHLVQVDGENRNTGGSSGSGKSTIFNALDYLLGLNDLPVTVLQSRLTKEKLTVQGEFEWDGKPITITRGSKLSIDIDGQTIIGSSALTEEKLDEILGMPRDLFRKILHKRQKEGGFFLDFTPKKTYEFLTDALNLVAERKKLEKVENKLSDLDKQRFTRQTAIMQAQSSLKAMQEAILALGLAPIKDIHQNVVLELKGRYDASAKRFQEAEEKFKQETQELESQRPKISVTAYDSSERTRLETRKSALDSVRASKSRQESSRISELKNVLNEKTILKNDLQYKIRDGDTSKAHATELAGQIKKIRETICPTCERPEWVHESAKVKENEFLAKLATCKEKIMVGENAKIKIHAIDADIVELLGMLVPKEDPELLEIDSELVTLEPLILAEKTKESQHLAAQNGANDEKLRRYAALQQELRTAYAQSGDQVRGQADVDRRAFEAAVSKLKAYDDAFNKYESTLSHMKTNEAVYLKDLTENTFEFDKLSSEIEAGEEVKKAVKEFISTKFDEALRTISEKSTEIIRCVPTMSNATIEFEGQKETKDGKIKEEVNAVISMDGDIGIPIKSLSGGERSSVDLAVDLAVIDLVELVSGKGIDLYIMDEPFIGLDTVGIEMVLEFLKNITSSKKIIVVDHNPIIKEIMSNKILVIREGERSSIREGTANG